ncbi:MAG: CoA-binding protein [Bacteroidales bacterium]
MDKKTLVIGASPNPMRYGHKAVKRLVSHGVEVVAIGKRETEIAGVKVVKDKPLIENLHTVTLYLNPGNQEEYLDYILELKPRRIIFNPGTFNPRLEDMAQAAGIEVVEDCTLLMLGGNSY